MEQSKTQTAESPDDINLWNDEDASELSRPKDMTAYEISVTGRDWTIETIVSQIKQGNIDLDPEFQRRNAWRDVRRSRFIESLILRFPVPQIVLAENPRKKGSFIVIDGKQRLTTIAGIYLENYRAYWTQDRFTELKVLTYLNGTKIDDFLSDTLFETQRRLLLNADNRTSLITGFKDEAVLYDIFYRINTGSVPLSSQELRQVLSRGSFSRYLLEVTSVKNPIWGILPASAPDSRLRDVELLLRMIAWRRFAHTYAGNMKKFLDDTMKTLNKGWDESKDSIIGDVQAILDATACAQNIFGKNAGRKFKHNRYEPALNRAIFEVQVFFLLTPSIAEKTRAHKDRVIEGFKNLCSNQEFLAAVESTTKSLRNTSTRFDSYRNMLRTALNARIEPINLAQPLI